MSITPRELLKLSKSYGRKSKFRNIPTQADGIKFDSRGEARRYGELKLLERAGELIGLRVHEKFPLCVNGVELGYYEADFVYQTKTEQLVVEDVKGGEGSKTPLYRWKKRHMKAQYGIEIREVT